MHTKAKICVKSYFYIDLFIDGSDDIDSISDYVEETINANREEIFRNISLEIDETQISRHVKLKHIQEEERIYITTDDEIEDLIMQAECEEQEY